MSRAWAPKMAPYCRPSLSLTACWLLARPRRRPRPGPGAAGALPPRADRLSTKRWGMRNPSVSSTRAGPMATPGETGMPRLISMKRSEIPNPASRLQRPSSQSRPPLGWHFLGLWLQTWAGGPFAYPFAGKGSSVSSSNEGERMNAVSASRAACASGPGLRRSIRCPVRRPGSSVPAGSCR